jgi:phage N-6-adenine-methyltransferase
MKTLKQTRNANRLAARQGLGSVHFSSKTDEWPTPQWLFDALSAEFHFTLDPCSTHENAKCKKHFTKADNGLEADWGDETVWMNPPYGRAIGLWMKKAYKSAQLGATVVCLVPSRTDTRWWHKYVMKAEIRLLPGRIQFGNAKASAPFPSAIVIFRPPTFSIQSFAISKEALTPSSNEHRNN